MSEQAINYQDQTYEQTPRPELTIVSNDFQPNYRLMFRSSVKAYLEGETDEEPVFSIDDPRAVRDVKVALASVSAKPVQKEDADDQDEEEYESLPAQKAARIRHLQTLLVPKLEEAEQMSVGRLANYGKTDSKSEIHSIVAEAKKAWAQWIADIACRDIDTDQFYPNELFSRGRPSTNRKAIQERIKMITSVVEVCYTCPVRQQCEEHGRTAHPDKYAGISVFGGKFFGLTDSQKKYLTSLGLEEYIPEQTE